MDEKGPSLNEIRDTGVWDLYKVYEFNALLDMQSDQSTAAEQNARDKANKPDKDL